MGFLPRLRFEVKDVQIAIADLQEIDVPGDDLRIEIESESVWR